MTMIRIVLVLVTFIGLIKGGDEFEDYRCRCVCPSFEVLKDPKMNDTHRRIYIEVVPAESCTCERVVFNTIEATHEFQQRFCPRCVCNYEVRNTTTMKIVVIMIMIAISLLFIYMIFMICLDPLMNPKKHSTNTQSTAPNYEQQRNESQLDNPNQECVFSEPNTSSLQDNRRISSAVFNLVTQEQSRWRKQVHQQRQSVYNKHEILN